MNKNLKRLIFISTLTCITEIYMNTFLSARIYELAGSSVQILSAYYIIEYVFIMLTFLAFGSKIKSYPLQTLRIGIILNLSLLMFIMITKEEVSKYYIPFAVLLGISQGAYYSPFAVLVGIYNDNAVKFCTVSRILSNIVNVVFPVTIGVYISSTSFTSITVYMVVISVIQILISLNIDKVHVKTSCNVKRYINILKNCKENKKVINYYRISFLDGIVSSVLDRTVLILILMIFGSSLQLGILNTVFAIFTIITTWLMKQFYKKEKSKILIIVSAFMPMLAVMMLVLITTEETVIFYKIISSVFICILSLICNIERYDCISETIHENFSTEHQLLSEISLGLGRIFGLSILILVDFIIGGLYAIMIMLIIISISIIVYAYFIVKQ